MEDLSRRLIAAVKQYPVVFDVDHRHYKTAWERDRAWTRISRSIGISVNLAKKKWRNLRDCYSKHLKMSHSRQRQGGGGKYKYWHLSEEMEFMRPFSAFTRKATAAGGEARSEGEEEPHHMAEDDDADAGSTTAKYNHLWQQEVRKRRRQQLPAPAPPRAPRPAPPLNATEHIFLGYAKLVDNFTPRRRAEIKLKIAKLVSAAEMEEVEEEAEVEVLVEMGVDDPLGKAVAKLEPQHDEERLDESLI